MDASKVKQRGRWASTPDSARKSPRKSIPFDPESSAALAHLMKTRPSMAAAVRDAVISQARREGWTGPIADDHGA